MTEDEKHERLTWLWHEAGEPMIEGLRLANDETVTLRRDDCGNPPCFFYPLVEDTDGDGVGGYGYVRGREDEIPDWDHPMTEFAMMCIAEQTVGEPMCWEDLNGWWSALPVSSEGGVLDQYPTRIECALWAIIGRESGAGE